MVNFFLKANANPVNCCYLKGLEARPRAPLFPKIISMGRQRFPAGATAFLRKSFIRPVGSYSPPRIKLLLYT